LIVIAKDSILAHLLEAGVPLKPDGRALVLENNKELEEAYASVARKGDTQAPTNPEDAVEFHYICFVRSSKDGHLYQMDGDRKRPIDLGALAAEEDVLSDTCLAVIRQMVQESNRGGLNFSLIALVPADT
jgi:ubiquitin carboxyl-terminal hydrolase L3